MALALSLVAESQAGSGTSDTSSSFTPTAGSALFVLWGGSSTDSATMAGESSTLTSSAGFTCTLVSDSAAYGNGSAAMASLWKVTNVTATNGTLTFKYSQSGTDRSMALFAYNISQVTGQDSTNPVVQFVEREDNTFNGTVFPGTLAAFASANNATYMASCSPFSNADMTLGSGYSALGVSHPSVARRFAQYKLANDTAPSSTDASTGKYACWGVEVKAAGGGAAVIIPPDILEMLVGA